MFCNKDQLAQPVKFQFCIPVKICTGKATVLTEALHVFHQCLHQVNMKCLTKFSFTII